MYKPCEHGVDYLWDLIQLTPSEGVIHIPITCRFCDRTFWQVYKYVHTLDKEGVVMDEPPEE